MIRKMKRRVPMALAATALAIGAVGAVAAPASAMEKWEYTQVCEQNHGYGWSAWLAYPGQGAFGWRCIVANTSVMKSLDIQAYCQAWGFGDYARTNNTSDPYSWYCSWT